MPKEKCRRENPREHKKKTGRVFSSKLVKTNLSLATAVRSLRDPKTHQETAKSSRVPERPKRTQQEPGQPVTARIVCSENVDMYKAFTAVQQIMTKLNNAVSERDKIFSMANIVFDLMKQTGH
jgi:hypothetical protein